MTCKHDWHFVKGLTERLRCTRCGQMTWPKSVEERTQELLEDALTFGSAWSKGGERIDPLSVYRDTEPVPENFMDALKFDTAMRDVDAMVAVARADERGRMCEQLKECSSEKSTSNEANRSAVLGEGGQAN